MIPIHLAVEDDLSEQVLRKLLRVRSVKYHIGVVFKKGGHGYLKKQCGAFNNMAKACPVLLLTDLDQRPCAPELLNNWLTIPRHRDFLLRVAVREVEAWLLATDTALSGFLGLRSPLSIPDPEARFDPKMELLKLAEKSPRRKLREALVRRDTGQNLRQGPAYNSMLADFIAHTWNPEKAAEKCKSLEKLQAALTSLESSRNSGSDPGVYGDILP